VIWNRSEAKILPGPDFRHVVCKCATRNREIYLNFSTVSSYTSGTRSRTPPDPTSSKVPAQRQIGSPLVRLKRTSIGPPGPRHPPADNQAINLHAFWDGVITSSGNISRLRNEATELRNSQSLRAST
jgi:hypothetical protein